MINGNTPNPAFVGKIESQASKLGIPFRLVNDDTAKTGDDDSAILVVSKTAINQMRVEIGQVYPPELPKEELPAPKKKGLFEKLFGDQK